MRKKVQMNRQGCAGERKAHHAEILKQNMIKRLNRIEGQVRGISKMIDGNVYCDDVLQQMSSVESALSGVKTVLLDAHMRSCVIEQIREGKDEVMEKLIITLRKFLK